MDLEYIQKVKEWVEMDNQILSNKEQIKDVVERKKELEEEILTYIEHNKFDNLSLNISDGTIKFSKRNTSQPLSMRTLRIILNKYSHEKTTIDVDGICEFISTNLEKKTSIGMKRDIK